MVFPLPEPPHLLFVGDRANYVVYQRLGEVVEVSRDIGRLGLPYCRMKWDQPSEGAPEWVLMQHLWPEDEQAAEGLEETL